MSTIEGTVTKSRITLNDIAARTGLSASTISLVLNGRRSTGHISNATRQEVLSVADEMGYERPRRARGAGVHQIGVFSHPGAVFWPALGEVCHVLNDQNYRPITQVGYFPALGDFAQLLFDRFEIDGAIFIGAPQRPEDVPSAEIPHVTIGVLPEGVEGNVVCLDNFAAGRLAGEHLWELGHRVVGVVIDTGYDRLPRLAGLRAVWEEHGAPPAAVRVLPDRIPAGNVSEAELIAVVQRLLEAPSGEAPPTALFCVTDSWALRTIRALHRLGRHVPGDISVVGVDDVPLAAECDPALTTVRQSFRERGAAAAQLLLTVLQSPAERAPETLFQEPTLIIRESTGPAPLR